MFTVLYKLPLGFIYSKINTCTCLEINFHVSIWQTVYFVPNFAQTVEVLVCILGGVDPVLYTDKAITITYIPG